MTDYFLRRLVLIIPTFLGITMLVFCVTRFVPGGPIEQMIIAAKMGKSGSDSSAPVSTSGSQQQSNSPLSEDQLSQLREYYGFDKPILHSYFDWLWKVVRWDLGSSTRYNEPVWEIIKGRMPISLYYGLITMVLSYLICIPLGIVKAIRHGSAVDYGTSIVVFTGYALPSLIVAIMLLVVFASQLEWFPLGGFTGDDFESLTPFEQVKDLIWHSTLPLLSYMAGSFAVMTMVMKNSLLDHLAADYVRTAMAKGMAFRTAVFRHALRNSLIPIAATFGSNISVILSGSFLIERVFNINGFGLLGYESVVERDYPVVMGILVLSASLQLIGNMISDFCVALVDPRVQYD